MTCAMCKQLETELGAARVRNRGLVAQLNEAGAKADSLERDVERLEGSDVRVRSLLRQEREGVERQRVIIRDLEEDNRALRARLAKVEEAARDVVASAMSDNLDGEMLVDQSALGALSDVLREATPAEPPPDADVAVLGDEEVRAGCGDPPHIAGQCTGTIGLSSLACRCMRGPPAPEKPTAERVRCIACINTAARDGLCSDCIAEGVCRHCEEDGGRHRDGCPAGGKAPDACGFRWRTGPHGDIEDHQCVEPAGHLEPHACHGCPETLPAASKPEVG